ncbi:MAG: DUF58 domain-containing protein [Leptolyngbya sp. SIO4C1]|nr:DUF58 domain-containing protein [Leptolyngbya sp. SIO4C1]
MGLTPTRRLYGLLIASGAVAVLVEALLPAAGTQAQVLLGLLMLDGGLLVAMAVDSGLARSQRASVSRTLPPRLSIGRENAITLSVAASSPVELRLYDGYPAALGEMAMPIALRASQAQTVSYAVTPTQRGEFVWGDLQVQQRGPLGLAWHSWTVPQSQTTAVYPDLVGLRSLTLRLTLQSTGSVRQLKRIGIGTEFAELRDYGAGDDPRLIDWKATARRSQPLVRVLAPEREQTLLVLLDRGRLMTARVQRLSRFDWGLNATLSLALAGLHRGDRVGVGVFDRTLQTWIPPTGGRSHLQRLIEKLTPIQPVLLESDYLGAVTQLATRQHRRALVVVITDVVDSTASAELLTALTRLKSRHLPFCVTLRDPAVDRQAHTFRAEVEAAYGRAVALDLLAQRQAAFARLRQSGVLVLDAPANQISESLVEDYLRIKLKNRL